MSTSILQYLEDMNEYLRSNKLIKPVDKTEIYSTSQVCDDDDYANRLSFDYDQGQSLAFDPITPDNDDSAVAFRKKMNLDDEKDERMDDVQSPEEEKFPDSTSLINNINETMSESGPSHDKKSDDNNSKEDKIKISNKERARKARQRKKKYYEDLERRAEFLENKVTKLNQELEYLKQKLKIYEAGNKTAQQCTSVDFENHLFESIKTAIEKAPNEMDKLLEAFNTISEKYGPIGEEKVKILDYSFDMILENSLCGPGMKSLFYMWDREDIPKSAEDFDKYEKMKKYQQYESYPDPIIRQFIETKIKMGYTKAQFKNMLENQFPLVKSIKKEFKDSVNLMYQAKWGIFKALMSYDLFKRSWFSSKISKEEFIDGLDTIRFNDMKISMKDILNVEKQDLTINREFHIPNPKVFKKSRVLQGWMCPDEPAPAKLSGTYHITTIAWN